MLELRGSVCEEPLGSRRSDQERQVESPGKQICAPVLKNLLTQDGELFRPGRDPESAGYMGADEGISFNLEST